MADSSPWARSRRPDPLAGFPRPLVRRRCVPARRRQRPDRRIEPRPGQPRARHVRRRASEASRSPHARCLSRASSPTNLGAAGRTPSPSRRPTLERTDVAILVTCACGKQFQTGDEDAGRRARCPDRGRELIISSPGPTSDVPLEPEQATDDEFASPGPYETKTGGNDRPGSTAPRARQPSSRWNRCPDDRRLGLVPQGIGESPSPPRPDHQRRWGKDQSRQLLTRGRFRS